MIVKTHHMSGAGNAFVVIDEQSVEIPLSSIPSLVPSLCNRETLHLPNAEGVLVLHEVGQGSAVSTFYNPDGSTGAMCGNGGRCLVRFALDNGATLDAHHMLTFAMAGVLYPATVGGDNIICVEFPPPIEVRTLSSGTLPGLSDDATYVNVGSDHVVIEASAISTLPLNEIPLRAVAEPIRHHSTFPKGTNVNLVTISNRTHVTMRTFERGVEGETGACGTGAISTAIALWRLGRIGDSITITPSSGKPVNVTIHHDRSASMPDGTSISRDIASIRNIILCGDAVYDLAAQSFDTSSGTYV